MRISTYFKIAAVWAAILVIGLSAVVAFAGPYSPTVSEIYARQYITPASSTNAARNYGFDEVTLTNAWTAIGNQPTKIIVDGGHGGRWAIYNSAFVPSNVVLSMAYGARLYVTNGATLTFATNGFDAGPWTVFDGNGGLVRGRGTFIYRWPEWGNTTTYDIGPGSLSGTNNSFAMVSGTTGTFHYVIGDTGTFYRIDVTNLYANSSRGQTSDYSWAEVDTGTFYQIYATNINVGSLVANTNFAQEGHFNTLTSSNDATVGRFLTLNNTQLRIMSSNQTVNLGSTMSSTLLQGSINNGRNWVVDNGIITYQFSNGNYTVDTRMLLSGREGHAGEIYFLGNPGEDYQSDYTTQAVSISISSPTGFALVENSPRIYFRNLAIHVESNATSRGANIFATRCNEVFVQGCYLAQAGTNGNNAIIRSEGGSVYVEETSFATSRYAIVGEMNAKIYAEDCVVVGAAGPNTALLASEGATIATNLSGALTGQVFTAVEESGGAVRP